MQRDACGRALSTAGCRLAQTSSCDAAPRLPAPCCFPFLGFPRALHVTGIAVAQVYQMHDRRQECTGAARAPLSLSRGPGWAWSRSTAPGRAWRGWRLPCAWPPSPPPPRGCPLQAGWVRGGRPGWAARLCLPDGAELDQRMAAAAGHTRPGAREAARTRAARGQLLDRDPEDEVGPAHIWARASRVGCCVVAGGARDAPPGPPPRCRRPLPDTAGPAHAQRPPAATSAWALRTHQYTCRQ